MLVERQADRKTDIDEPIGTIGLFGHGLRRLWQAYRHLSIAGVVVLITGCASQPTTIEDANATIPASPASACVDAIATEDRPQAAKLDGEAIRVVNWNIQKGSHPDWSDDLRVIQRSADILILQEASPDLQMWDQLEPRRYQSFAQGYRGLGLNTGVMTLSAVTPMAECEFIEEEPWLGTPKAMLVTKYGLTGSDADLLVINIHGINFSFGMLELRRQMAAAEHVIAAHRGPVLFSGDFNTWHSARVGLIEEIMTGLGLQAVSYETDRRKRFLGWPLDHIYVRGLDMVTATTIDIESSDHNPMVVELRLGPEA